MGSPDRKETQPIFKPLENYIADSFSGCSALNASFFTVRAVTEQRSATSDRATRRQQSEPLSTPILEPDVFLSDLDAKTLLLGDFAENGSWWTGGRSWSPEKDGSKRRQGSPDRWKGIVSARSPRINWADLAEWYTLVINAGDLWRQKLNEISHDLGPSNGELLDSVSMSRLEREVAESQSHLHRSLLKSTENLLKRPRRPLKNPEDCRFLLMLLFNPLIYPSETHHVTPPAATARGSATQPSRSATGAMPNTSRRRVAGSNRAERNLGHHSGIVKRVLGLIANLPNDIHQFMVSWVSRFVDHHFQKTVELVGSFVTYRLSRQQKRAPEPNDPTAGLVPSFSNRETSHASQLHAALDARSSTASVRASSGKPSLAAYGDDWQVRAACRVMALLFQANVGHASRKRDVSMHTDQRLGNPALNARYRAQIHGQIVPVSIFYNSMLDYADLIADFEAWESTKTKFTFCQYSFLLSIYAKIHVLEHDARRQMEVKAREAFFDSILSRKAVSQYLVLKVRRECLVEDSLRNVSEVVGSGGGDIKKGLRIDFVGEEGIDSGGLRKEWFLLLVREIFDPTHGLFVYDEDSQYCYFNPYCFESSEQFFLVGVLLGLAIYNSTILDIAFPPFVFKKMLASAPSTGDKLTSTPKIMHGYTLEDLAEFRPALAKGLRQLLEFDGDVQETFCRDFVIEMDRYGEKIEVPLCPGGEKRAVTNANRREFVDMYIRYILDTAVARQYEPFKRGFFTVCGGNALSLFRPEEIELLVRGSDEPLDIASLRAVAVYEGWPKGKDTPQPDRQPQVIWFWDFFAHISPTDQRKMLSFITGSDRIPALGATNLIIKIGLLREKEDPMIIGAWKDPERFPVARTCFNSIGLYQYGSRKKLEHKLWTAVMGSEGFGLK
jgi:E3 ubiquitin-protein ligase HECTD2